MTTFLILLSIPFFIAAWRTTDNSKFNTRVNGLYQYIKRNPGLPAEQFEKHEGEFIALIDCGLIEIVDGKVYAKRHD